MAPGGEDQGGHRRAAPLLLAASERLYGALLAFYPEAFRRRYADEMRRDFADLSQEGLEEGGGAELARVWGAAFSDLATTALKERGTMLSRNARLPVGPKVAARALAAVALVAVTVAIASLVNTPQYEASAKILVGQNWGPQEGTPSEARFQGLQQSTMALAEATQSRPVAQETIERLELSTTPGAFLERLETKHVEDTQLIELSYTDPDPLRARRVANTVGDVLSRRASEVGPSDVGTNALIWQRAQLPEAPVSPNPLRNGLLALASGLLLFAGLACALPRLGASAVGRAALRTTRAAGSTARGARRVPPASPATEAAKEKELLGALARRGALTVAGAALETSLTVEEADRTLSALAAGGHLEVGVVRGRLLYSLWEGDAPL